jgi:hypothetical protein
MLDFASGEVWEKNKAPEHRSGAFLYSVIRRFWIEPAMVLNTAVS